VGLLDELVVFGVLLQQRLVELFAISFLMGDIGLGLGSDHGVLVDSLLLLLGLLLRKLLHLLLSLVEGMDEHVEVILVSLLLRLLQAVEVQGVPIRKLLGVLALLLQLHVIDVDASSYLLPVLR